MFMSLNAVGARIGARHWAGALAIAWATGAPALAQAQALDTRCGSRQVEILVKGYNSASGHMTPVLDGSGLGLFGATYTGMRSVRLDGSSAYRRVAVNGLTSTRTLSQGDYFLCTNAARAPADSTATVIVLRNLGLSGDFNELLPDASADNHWGSGTEDAVEAFHYSVAVRDWLSRAFGLDSASDAGGPMVAVVAVENDTPVLNAMYSDIPSIAGGRVIFTSSVPGIIGTFASAPDIVAHEWAHGITSHHASLLYERESGALDEAFSDWLGAAFGQPDQDDGAAGRWLVGERVRTVRDMRNPLAFRSPDTHLGHRWRLADTVSCPTPRQRDTETDRANDLCHIHANSGVGNKMFQLLADGGTRNGVRVDGLGLERATEIAMDAQRYQWTANTGYLNARAGMLAVAANHGEAAIAQTALAWRAVCVDDPRPPPPACPAANTLQALRVRVLSKLTNSGEAAVYMSLIVPELVGVSSASALGTLHFLVSSNANLDAAGIVARHASTRSMYANHHLTSPLFTGVPPGSAPTFYALLQRQGQASGPMVKVPANLGGTVPALRAETTTSDAHASTMTMVSGMDGTVVHLVAADSAPDAPDSALALFERADARVQAVSAGAGAVLSWDGLATGTDYVWHAVVVQSLSTVDREETTDIPGYYASARLSEPFRTTGSAVLLTLSPVPWRTRIDVGADTNADGALHYLVLPATAPAPDSVEALTRHASAREAEVTAGASTRSWTGLAPGTAYIAYAAMRTDDGDSPLMTKRISTTTQADAGGAGTVAGGDSGGGDAGGGGCTSGGDGNGITALALCWLLCLIGRLLAWRRSGLPEALASRG